MTATDLSFGPLTVRATIQQRQRGAEGFLRSSQLGSLSLLVPGRRQPAERVGHRRRRIGARPLFPSALRPAWPEFRGVERRFEIHGEPNNILVVDDYSHHPTEIAAALDAARRLNRRLVVAFQPHRLYAHGRTPGLVRASAGGSRSRIVLTDIYAAGEDPIPGITIERLAEAIRNGTSARVEVVPALDDVVRALVRGTSEATPCSLLGPAQSGLCRGGLWKRSPNRPPALTRQGAACEA